MPKGYPTTTPFCTVESCGLKTVARGFCKTHYYRWRANGDPLIVRRAPAGTGCTDPKGYRKITLNGHLIGEHRAIMSTILNRPLSPTEVVHHIDGNPSNNAPENLIVLTRARHTILHLAKGVREETRKQCTRCLKVKPRTEFQSHYKKRKTSEADPHHPWCKDCRRAHALRKWRERHPSRPTRQTRYKSRDE